MTKNSIEEILGSTLYNQVVAKLGKDTTIAIVDANAPMIPKRRLDEVIADRSRLREQIEERDRQLVDLEARAGNTADLKQQIAELQAKNKQAAEAAEKQLREQRLSMAIERAVRSAGARNVHAVSALLDTSKILLDGENLLGVDGQLAALKESDPYLFGVELKGRAPEGTGKPPQGQENPWKKETWNLTKQGEAYRKDPDLAARLMREAGK